jgi:hypothetical protein
MGKTGIPIKRDIINKKLTGVQAFSIDLEKGEPHWGYLK